jgi:hypothetical protein
MWVYHSLFRDCAVKIKIGHVSMWVNTARVKKFRLRRQRGARPFLGFGNVEALIRDVTPLDLELDGT